MSTSISPSPPGRRCRRSKMGEAAGECAAVCCCCPCAMAHLLLLAVYRLPRGIWRRKKKKRLLRNKREISSEEKETQMKITPPELSDDESAADDRADEWENEVWDRFGAGFWRSCSDKKDD